MQKKLNIYSCQQDWNKMTETENGRMCERCNRCLVDFRDMELEAIHDFRQKAKTESICGVYRPDQVASTIPIHQIPRKKKKKWWALAASLAAAFASNAAVMPIPPPVNMHQIDLAQQAARTNTPCCTINGQILDKHTGEPLIGASILANRQPVGTSDLEGKFEIELFDPAFRANGRVELQFIYAGYEIIVNQVSNEQLSDYMNILMVHEAPLILPERQLVGVMIFMPEPIPKEPIIKRLFHRKKAD